MQHIIGLDDPSGRWYLFWSGVGSDITEFAVLGGLFGLLRKHNCHVRHCWRLGRVPVDGTPFTVCFRHHPESAPTASELS